MQLLLATSNPGKLAELRSFLSFLPITLVGLSDVSLLADARETGKTFEENAVQKAMYYSRKSGLPTLADDGGFEIDALGGEPGVRSHRWVSAKGEDTDEALISHAMRRLADVPHENRGAQLRLVLCLLFPNGAIYISQGCVRGIVPQKAAERRTPGFPYRSLLFIPELQKFYDHADMTQKETEQYNHRKKAVLRLVPALESALT